VSWLRRYEQLSIKMVVHFGAKFQAEGDIPNNHSSCFKTTRIAYDIRMWAYVAFVSSHIHAFDRRTDRRTDSSVMAIPFLQSCSVVKIRK